MKSIALLIYSFLLMRLTAGATVDLLAGRTLDDFECWPMYDQATISSAYSLSNGVLRVAGEIPALLVTKEKYEKFNLSFDICYPDGGFGDGGVTLFVCQEPNHPQNHTGMEIQTKTGQLGDIWALPGFCLSRNAATPPPKRRDEAVTGGRFRRIPRLVDVPHVPGKWMHVDLIGCGKEFELRIDGKMVNRCVVMDEARGRIGFQTRPYPQGKSPILYRNLKVKFR